MREFDLIRRLKALPLHPGARGLNDDAAVLSPPLGRDLVLTHDVLVEGVHYLPDDPPGDVAWKLLAVNLSDLAGKGAEPIGVLLGFTLSGDNEWNAAFVEGLERGLRHFKVPLLGGDTVTSPKARVLGLTAIGQVPAARAPSRTGARPGDDLWVSGTIGDAGAGLRVLLQKRNATDPLIKRYRLPMPRLAAGQALAPLVNAMMDVSDGLLIDAGRMASASDVAININLPAVPLSEALLAMDGGTTEARLKAATCGDDYELLFAAAPAERQTIESLAERLRVPLTRIGEVLRGSSLTISDENGAVELPTVLGWEHSSDIH